LFKFNDYDKYDTKLVSYLSYLALPSPKKGREESESNCLDFFSSSIRLIRLIDWLMNESSFHFDWFGGLIWYVRSMTRMEYLLFCFKDKHSCPGRAAEEDWCEDWWTNLRLSIYYCIAYRFRRLRKYTCFDLLQRSHVGCNMCSPAGHVWLVVDLYCLIETYRIDSLYIRAANNNNIKYLRWSKCHRKQYFWNISLIKFK